MTDKREALGDIWTLETPIEEQAIEELNVIIGNALTPKGGSDRAYLRTLWDGESWKSIKEKLQTEGSTWHVWWMDGVHQHMANQAAKQVVKPKSRKRIHRSAPRQTAGVIRGLRS